MFKKDEMLEFIDREPASKRYFHPFLGSYEFINNKERYCLYLSLIHISEPTRRS